MTLISIPHSGIQNSEPNKNKIGKNCQLLLSYLEFIFLKYERIQAEISLSSLKLSESELSLVSPHATVKIFILMTKKSFNFNPLNPLEFFHSDPRGWGFKFLE